MSGPWACRSLLLSHSWYAWCHCFLRKLSPPYSRRTTFYCTSFYSASKVLCFLPLSFFLTKWRSGATLCWTILLAPFSQQHSLTYFTLFTIVFVMIICGQCDLLKAQRKIYHFFSNKVFLMEACTLFFRQNATAYLTDCSREETTFTCTGKQTNQKICDSLYCDIHLIVVIWT